MADGEYRPVREPESEFLDVGGLQYHVSRWGPRGGYPVVLLHGWMDCGAAFQFLVDDLPGDWEIVAPDWRGFGRSDRAACSYYFPDYLADLDAVLDHYFPDRAMMLVGHSMGGNVAGLYAGTRPERIERLVSIEGFGLAETPGDEAPQRYAKWLDSLRHVPRLRPFDDYDQLAGHLRRNNPHLTIPRALYVARCWGFTGADGAVYLRGDPRHKRPNPVLYRLDEAKACWRRITAPTLWLMGSDSRVRARSGADQDFGERLGCIARISTTTIHDAGHSIHLDQPRILAGTIAAFASEAH